MNTPRHIPMRNLVIVIGRSFFLSSSFLFHLHKVRFFPQRNSITSIPVGSYWIWPGFATITKVISNYKQAATRASVDEDEVKDDNLNQILNAIENAPESTTRKIETAYVDNLCKAGNLFVAVRLLHLLHDKNIFLGPDSCNLILVAAGEKNDLKILSRVFKELIVSCESLPSALYLKLARGFVKTNDDVQLLALIKEVSELTSPSSTTVVNRFIFALLNVGSLKKPC